MSPQAAGDLTRDVPLNRRGKEKYSASTSFGILLIQGHQWGEKRFTNKQTAANKRIVLSVNAEKKGLRMSQRPEMGGGGVQENHAVFLKGFAFLCAIF